MSLADFSSQSPPLTACRFRWVVCQLDSLRGCLNTKALQTALRSLPKTLDETYERIFTGIEEDYNEDALTLLQWLCFSVRSLTLGEVNDAITVNAGEDSTFDPSRRLHEARDILLICPSMITIPSSSIVSLAHFSVKEYLESSRISSSRAATYKIVSNTAHKLMAAGCLVYLLQFDQPFLSSVDVSQKFPLAFYAAEFWTKHFRECEACDETKQLNGMAVNLLENLPVLQNRIRIYDHESVRTYVRSSLNDPRPVRKPLYYAALIGLSSVVTSLLSIGTEIIYLYGTYSNALQAAIHGNHTATALHLIYHAADIHQRGGEYGQALSAATYRGSLEIVRLLLDRGVHPDTVGTDDDGIRSSMPLHVAAQRGHLDVVQLMIENGADVNRGSRNRKTPLGQASAGGHKLVVDLLIEKGSIVGDGDALGSATSGNQSKMAELLIQKGATVQGDIDALEGAACNGNLDPVKKLVNYGAAIHMKGCDVGNILITATAAGQVDVVRYLLNAVVNPNMSNPVRSTRAHVAALQIAAVH